jgi:tellurite resistance protein TerC
VPAAFAVTKEPFIIYSSNLLAILGLRALYLVLAGMLVKLRYLKYGLAAVLGFAGGKLVLARWGALPPLVSVGIIALCILASVLASLWANRRDRRRALQDPQPDETMG